MPGEYFSGKDAHLAIEDSSSPPNMTVLSDIFDVVSVDTNPTTDRFIVKPYKATRAVSIAGHTQELWTIRGPLTAEAVSFFQPMANTTLGKARAYIWGPYNNTDGNLKFEGTLDVLDFIEHGPVNADGVPEFSCTVSILTKTAGTFVGGS